MHSTAGGATRLPRPLVVAGFVFVLAAAASAGLIWRMEQQRLQVERARVLELAGNHARALQISIDHDLSAAFTLAALVRQGNGTFADFDGVVGKLLPYFPGVAALELAPGGVITNVVPLAGNEKALGLDLLKDPAQRREAAIARDTGRLTLAGPINLVQGGVGIAGRLPVFLDGGAGEPSFWGFALVVLRFPGALGAARFSELVLRGYQYELWRVHPADGRRQVIDASSTAPLADPEDYPVTLPNGVWKLSVAPTRGWADWYGLSFKAALALAFSLMLAHTARLMVELKAHQRGLEELVATRTAEIRASERKFTVVFDRSPVATALAADDGTLLDVNQAFTETLGYTPGEALGKSKADLRIWVDPDDQRRYHRMTRDGSYVHGFETQLRAKNGRVISALLSGGVVSVDGRNCLLSVIVDVTEQQRMERELRGSEARFRELLENMHLMAVILDRAGVVTFCNDFLLAKTGWTAEEVVGGDWFERAFAPEAAGAARRAFAEAVADGSLPAHDETLVSTRGGPPRIVVWDNTLLRAADESIVGAACIGMDVTEHRDLEGRLLQAAKMEAIGKLAGGIAHDFNNLLTPILGYAELLAGALPAGSEEHEQVGCISQAALKARDLTLQLLTFGRKQSLDMRVVDLNRVVASFAGILRRTVRESIEIRLELTHGPASIRADRTQLEQVLMNLVVNAQDAIADAGVITIGTEPAVVDAAFALGHPGAVPGPHVRLVVRDSGRGIDKAAIERIFEPFFSTKEVGKGAGLGLAIVYGIVQQHGGFIDVASEPQRGTTFRIVFPRAEGVEAEETVAPETAPPAGEASGTVLLVEDNLDVMALVRRVLTARGYSVIAAPDPRLALELAGAGRIDLLVTDVVMPGMNGPELHRRLLKTHPGLKVLFMSGYTDNLVARQVDLDPGADFIQKPFAIETLARKVAALCPGAGTGPGPAS